jgi:hypothetical protein
VSDLDEIVSVTITTTSAGLTQRGFGTPLVAGYHTAWLERVRTYTDEADVIDDGIPEDHPVYLAVQSIFAQNPRPPQVKVGRRAGAPTQAIAFQATTPVAGEVFAFTVGGVEFSVTADGTPTLDEISAAFELLINADDDAVIASGVTSTTGIQVLDEADFNGVRGDTLDPPRNLTATFNAHADWDASTLIVTGTDRFGRVQTENFPIPNGGNVVRTGEKVFATVTSITVPIQSGTGGTLKVGVGTLFANADLAINATDNNGGQFGISANTPGDWYAYTDVTGNLGVTDSTGEPVTTLTSDLDAIAAADPDFYGVCVPDAASAEQIEAVATWTESNERIYIAHTMDSGVPTSAIDDIASTLRDNSFRRTHAQYQRTGHGDFPDAAMLGRMLPTEPGAATWEYKTLAGVPVDDPSATEKTYLADKNAGWYESLSGANVTRNSRMADGTFIDVVIFTDWLRVRIQERIAAFFIARDKVPYTDGSVEALKGEISAVLKLGIAVGGLAADPAPTVTAPKVADVPVADRENRHLPDIRFSARLAGAIHKATVRGVVSV